VGLAILGPLRELDEVAYLRFASVYRSFESLEDFEDEITLLRAEREPLGVEQQPQEPTAIHPHPATSSSTVHQEGQHR
jgi:transcriptional repressor NrdR